MQKSVVSVMCASPGGPRVSLSVYEWFVLEELVEILQPLEEATRELSTEKTVSCSKVIPLLNALNYASISMLMMKPKFPKLKTTMMSNPKKAINRNH